MAEPRRQSRPRCTNRSIDPSPVAALWDSIDLDIDRQVLDHARKSDGILQVVMAVLVSGSSARCAYSACEYGDGEGAREVERFVTGVRAAGLLLPDELLDVRVIQIGLAITGEAS